MKKRTIILLLFFVLLMLFLFFRFVPSTLKMLILYQTQYKATEIIHRSVTEEMEASSELLKNAVKLQYSDDGKITAVITDAYLFSIIKEHLTDRLLNEFSDVSLCKTEIPLFSLFSIPSISRSGPGIPFCLSIVGIPQTEIKGDLSSFGINQNLYQITLSYSANVSALFPFYPVSTVVSDQVILYEIVFAGEIPGVVFDQK